ncbi:response regulator transcription factor [Dyadobacter chenwenxiniae]|uniref:Response regulator transcription factor n=1 Tax=Dyadobacter chenwenxiniae TaxID=2906456 RepID=A0A9X1TD00_9BACT|nr:response regulator transcription factor [Dyadobacter chenwenxiniae]MCF0053963.1 response regulator transcription factor [Dyadobacter chenwenxiniae]MCF0061376.1 response regulator transcription factor [Dyadobacter chenwenxiniae]UON81198.1 response regulator transcription factor [Dyadobacter chenwenxiniae]
MKLLLIEDEPSVISLIQRSLSASGHEITVAMDGKSGLEMATHHVFDMIILDLMLPVINGMEVCRKIRSEGLATPILMLTALGTTENIVSGLDAGADDYMTKPFKLAELEARIRTLTRRGKEVEKENNGITLKIADLVLNTETKIVQRNGQTIDLTATEFRLLEFLIHNRNKVLNRMEILENVWDINFNLGTNVVDVYINYLRKKVDKNQKNKLIHTVFGMGYVMRQTYEDPN